MENILVASNTNTTLQIISGLLQNQTFDRIVTTQNAAEARRYLLSESYDLIIIDAPLSDEFGSDFAIHAAETTDAGIIIICQSNLLNDISSEVEEDGVFAIPKPISPEFFYQAVKLLDASRKRVKKLEKENMSLQKKIEEIRLVDRAKCILIQYLNMTEVQAHHHIEKRAMDLRQSKEQVATQILKTYER